MSLDKLAIGTRIRAVREKTFNETRASFADRCRIKRESCWANRTWRNINKPSFFRQNC